MESSDLVLQVRVANVRVDRRDDEHTPAAGGPQHRAGLCLTAARLECHLDRRVLRHLSHREIQFIVSEAQRQLLLAGFAATLPGDGRGLARADQVFDPDPHLTLHAGARALQPRHCLGLQAQRLCWRRHAALQPHIVIKHPTAHIGLHGDGVGSRPQQR